jgi:hypothetical protein
VDASGKPEAHTAAEVPAHWQLVGKSIALESRETTLLDLAMEKPQVA